MSVPPNTLLLDVTDLDDALEEEEARYFANESLPRLCSGSSSSPMSFSSVEGLPELEVSGKSGEVGVGPASQSGEPRARDEGRRAKGGVVGTATGEETEEEGEPEEEEFLLLASLAQLVQDEETRTETATPAEEACASVRGSRKRKSESLTVREREQQHEGGESRGRVKNPRPAALSFLLDAVEKAERRTARKHGVKRRRREGERDTEGTEHRLPGGSRSEIDGQGARETVKKAEAEREGEWGQEPEDEEAPETLFEELIDSLIAEQEAIARKSGCAISSLKRNLTRGKEPKKRRQKTEHKDDESDRRGRLTQESCTPSGLEVSSVKPVVRDERTGVEEKRKKGRLLECTEKEDGEGISIGKELQLHQEARGLREGMGRELHTKHANGERREEGEEDKVERSPSTLLHAVYLGRAGQRLLLAKGGRGGRGNAAFLTNK